MRNLAYEVLGTPMHRIAQAIDAATTSEELAKLEKALETRNAAIIDKLTAHMEGRETVVRTYVWGRVDTWLDDGRNPWSTLRDALDNLEVKEGVDLVRYAVGGTCGIVAYYSGRDSFLEIITDADAVAKIKAELEEGETW